MNVLHPGNRRLSTHLFRRYSHCAAVGFAILGLGYLLRGALVQASAALGLLLGVFPNLLGSFATPFYLLLVLPERILPPHRKASPVLFLAINLFTFGVSLLIEWAHVALGLGFFDPNDLAASILGGTASMIVFRTINRENTPAG